MADAVDAMSPTAHLDTFARDNLPPRELWPELVFELPELRYPERLNCATARLDRAVERGWGERTAILAPGGLRWTYAQLLAAANRNTYLTAMKLVSFNCNWRRATEQLLLPQVLKPLPLAARIRCGQMETIRSIQESPGKLKTSSESPGGDVPQGSWT